MGPGTDRPLRVPSWLGYLAATDDDMPRPAFPPEDRLVGVLPGRLPGDVEMIDDLIGTPNGGHPDGSPEAWQAVLRVRRQLFGADVTTERIIRRQPAPVPKVECLYCLREFSRTAPGQIWCATCDKQIQANKARAWNQARRTRANQVEGRRLERIAGTRA